MAAKFTFGAPSQSQTANPFGSLGATSGTAFGVSKPNTGFGSFGSNTTSTASGNLFGSLGNATKTTASSLFGGFGTATTSSTGFGTTGFGFGSAAKSTGTGLFGTAATTLSAFNFGGTGSTGLFGGSAFGAPTTSSSGFSFTQSNPGFGLQKQQQQQLQLQQLAAEQQALNPLNAMTTALSMPVVFGDERDSILAKFNQIQALWGAGKGYYTENQQPIAFTMENPFCRFKTIGYSCLPNAKDSDGLIALDLKHKIDYVKTNQQQLVESLHKILGGSPTLVVCVDGVRELPEDKTEVIFYIVERAMNGTSRRIPATDLYLVLSQKNYKDQLTNLGTESMLPKTSLSESQLENFLANPPLGIDPIIWEQAKKENPLPKKLIPVPMIGFSELLNRLRHQEHEAEQHKNRIDLMSDEVVELQKAHSTTMAKLSEYKRKHLELGHRILQIMIHQQTTRKIGYAIEPEEEQLRIQLESIVADINSPMHLKGRLNDLLSQIRVQAQGTVQRSEPKYSMDDNLRLEIKQHLERQQNGILQLVNIIKDDLEDLRTIENGLIDPSEFGR